MSKGETTIVTTIQVTHIIPGGVSEKDAAMIAAQTADTLRAGYADRVLEAGRPDDITVAGVQRFVRDGGGEPA